MILTQSQVSVFLSSIIILLFTLALFLSGYVLQQKTVTHLRAAIRPPQPPSHIYAVSSPAPPTVLTADNIGSSGLLDADTPTTLGKKSAEDPSPAARATDQDVLASYYLADATRQSEHEKLPFLVPRPAASTSRTPPSTSWVSTALQRWIERVQGKTGEEGEEEMPLESLGRAERRRRIKRDIQRLGSGEDVDFSRMYRPRKRGW